VHGISNEDVSKCRNAQAVLDDFIQFLGNGPITLIAHNASFDKRMIESSFKVSISNDSSAETYTQIIPKVLREATWICTMKMSKQRYPDKFVPMTSEPVKHTLKDCCNRANIPYMDGHSALPDAQMCGKV
jgi:DNA polymerase III epsilon subunit-like protein